MIFSLCLNLNVNNLILNCLIRHRKLSIILVSVGEGEGDDVVPGLELWGLRSQVGASLQIGTVFSYSLIHLPDACFWLLNQISQRYMPVDQHSVLMVVLKSNGLAFIS